MKKTKFVHEKAWATIRGGIWKSRGLFLGLVLILICETMVSLWLPQILSLFIDNLDRQGREWLVLCALGYCMAVILKGAVGAMNKYLSEKAGWRLCDMLRVDLFRRIFSFDVQRHKMVQEGYFLERVEGNINHEKATVTALTLGLQKAVGMAVALSPAVFSGRNV